MNRGLAVAGILACLSALAWLSRPAAPPAATLPGETAAVPATASRPDLGTAAPVAREEAAVAGSRQQASPQDPPTVPDAAMALAPEEPLARRFEQAQDLLPLYLELQSRTAAGDAEAAFYLLRVQQTCAYRSAGDKRSLAEALADFDRRHLDPRREATGAVSSTDWKIEEARAGMERAWKACPSELLQRLEGSDPDALLQQAADLGYPMAQAMMASRLLRESREAGALESARDYQRAAVLSRDPATLFEIARGVGLGADATEAVVRGNAWRLLACWHGLDCGPDNPLIQQTVCHNPASARCIPGAGLEDYLQTWDAQAYQATYALADQMMQAMNDGRWQDLDF